jgi:hypothetical protein
VGACFSKERPGLVNGKAAIIVQRIVNKKLAMGYF